MSCFDPQCIDPAHCLGCEPSGPVDILKKDLLNKLLAESDLSCTVNTWVPGYSGPPLAVHHLDGNPTNNDPNNLVAYPPKAQSLNDDDPLGKGKTLSPSGVVYVDDFNKASTDDLGASWSSTYLGSGFGYISDSSVPVEGYSLDGFETAPGPTPATLSINGTEIALPTTLKKGDVVTVKSTVKGGTFTMSVNGESHTFPYDATAEQIQQVWELTPKGKKAYDKKMVYLHQVKETKKYLDDLTTWSYGPVQISATTYDYAKNQHIITDEELQKLKAEIKAEILAELKLNHE